MNLIFNELSIKDIPQEKDEGKKIFEQFIIAYNESIKSKYGFLREIKTCKDFNSIEIAQGYYAAQWRNNSDKDLANRFRGICDRQIIMEMNEDERELRCSKGCGKGLLSAYVNNNVAISMVTDEVWSEFFFEAELYDLVKDTSSKISVFNLTNSNQLNNYFQQIKCHKLETVNLYNTGKELLKNIDKLFPSLIFHINARNQLDNKVDSQHIPAILKKLVQLDVFFSVWDGKPLKESDFESKMTTESKATLEMFKKEHTFDFSGKKIIVSHHLRYTGNIAGRIYFFPDPHLRKGIVCSLTTKLQTVTDRKS